MNRFGQLRQIISLEIFAGNIANARLQRQVGDSLRALVWGSHEQPHPRVCDDFRTNRTHYRGSVRKREGVDKIKKRHRRKRTSDSG